MKRFLGIMLALALVFSMVPTAGAATTDATPTYEYVFTSVSLGKNATYTVDDAVADSATATLAGGAAWKPVRSVGKHSSAFLTSGFRNNVKVSNALLDNYLKGNNYVVFEISVPETAAYNPALNYFTHRYGSIAEIYLFEKEVSSVSKEYAGKIIDGTYASKVLLSGSINTYEKDAKTECQNEKKRLEEFESANDISLDKNKSYYLMFTLDGPATKNDVTINDTAQYYYYHLYSFVLTKVETAEEDATVSGPISFVATSNVGTGDMMQVSGFEYDNFIDEIPAGTYVTVTAPEKEGYEFKHWLRGSRDNGVYISNESSYSFTALTNTFLTAVYEKKSDESDNTAVVEFYNGNGQYLEKKTSTIGGTVALPTKAPALTGFEFADEWKTESGAFTAETILGGKLTRAVAQFDVINTTFDVTDKRDNSVYNLFYGEKKTLTSDKAVYWVRDNTIVAYGTSYTYAAWDDTEISTSENGELNPVVLLDADAKDGARMIEYNAAGKNVIEVGLVFGSVNNVTIESCNSKATSQYRNQHGQFTAKPNGTEAYARGYLIYEDNGTYKVVYSK